MPVLLSEDVENDGEQGGLEWKETEFFILNLVLDFTAFIHFCWYSVSKVRLFMMHACSVAVNINAC